MGQAKAKTCKIAVVQCPLSGTRDSNLDQLARLIGQASAQGAQVVVLPELHDGPYFCKQSQEHLFRLALPLANHPTLLCMTALAKQYGVVLPVSLFERDGPHFYNTVVMVDGDGSVLGHYRKSHIPDGPGYEEKFYFRPGRSPPQVFSTCHGNLGVGICWDQWFPEVARLLTLQGADVLLYPTAIGSEPHDSALDTQPMWRRAMVGHAVCNMIPVAAANRIGVEDEQRFYGSSFVCDHFGAFQIEMDRENSGVGVCTVSFEQAERYRAAFGFFRDRRPELYQGLVIG